MISVRAAGWPAHCAAGGERQPRCDGSDRQLVRILMAVILRFWRPWVGRTKRAQPSLVAVRLPSDCGPDLITATVMMTVLHHEAVTVGLRRTATKPQPDSNAGRFCWTYAPLIPA
jgi:hypothetical protein